MALARLAPIDRATLVYVAMALAFTLARGPRTWPAAVLLPLWLLLVALLAAGAVLVPAALLLSLATVYCQLHYAIDALAGAALAAAVLIAGRRAGYHSIFRSQGRRREAHGEAS